MDTNFQYRINSIPMLLALVPCMSAKADITITIAPAPPADTFIAPGETIAAVVDAGVDPLRRAKRREFRN